MLEIYDPIYSVSINGSPFEPVSGPFDNNWLVSDKELPKTELLLDNIPFAEAYEWLENNYISGARPCRTIFKGNPQISLQYYPWYDPTYVTEKKCKKFSLLIENKLRVGITMEWIARNLPVDQAIQYFTERGMSIKK